MLGCAAATSIQGGLAVEIFTIAPLQVPATQARTQLSPHLHEKLARAAHAVLV